MPPLELVVIILNYKNAFVTKECIASILPGLNEGMTLLLVDNGSKDGSLEEIEQAFPAINMLAIPENLGFAGGFNAGIAWALETGAKRILLANNDTVFEQDTITQLMRSACDVAVPKILFFDNPDTIWSAGARWRAFPPGVVMRGFMKKDTAEYHRPVSLDYATGCVFLARSEVFRRAGGFAVEYGSYMEDYDFFYRVRQHGFSVGYVPSARLLHRVSQTLGSRSRKQYQFLGRNTVLFYRFGNRFPLWQLIMHTMWVFLREVLFGRFVQAWSFLQGVQSGFIYLHRKERQG